MAKKTVAEWFKALEELNNMDVDLENSPFNGASREILGLDVIDIETVYLSVKKRMDRLPQEPEPKGLF